MNNAACKNKSLNETTTNQSLRPKKSRPTTNIGKTGHGSTSRASKNEYLKSKPWLNSKGKMRSDRQIKKLGQSWSASTWEEFLKATVDVEDPNEDVTDSFPFMDTVIVANSNEFLSYLRNINEYSSLKVYLGHALKKLSSRQRQIMRMKYWDGLTAEEIQTNLRISQDTIRTTKAVATKKLKEILLCENFREEVIAMQLFENTVGSST
jgi:RNA polymerase sigma factor (sigma-70 family)